MFYVHSKQQTRNHHLSFATRFSSSRIIFLTRLNYLHNLFISRSLSSLLGNFRETIIIFFFPEILQEEKIKHNRKTSFCRHASSFYLFTFFFLSKIRTRSSTTTFSLMQALIVAKSPRYKMRERRKRLFLQ